MKPWIVTVAYDLRSFAAFQRQLEVSGILHVPRNQKAVLFDGGINEDTTTFCCDDEGTADALMKTLSENWPHRTYIKARSITAVFREPGAVKTVEFSDKGVLPK